MQVVEGVFYRGIQPKYAHDPCSGEGAKKNGGRFNPKGVAALYLSENPHTVALELTHGFSNLFQPTMVISYRISIDCIYDLTNDETLKSLNVSRRSLASPWLDLWTKGLEPPQWSLARRLIAAGCKGIYVQSFAPQATATDRNLVLWKYNDGPEANVCPVDDEGRLTVTSSD
ncbi:RES family NAD+ phosphorylase [Xanthobacter autotrophicus]|uniref:RES family NAD+ phosphorylase n=1 Tax=Xanthobacter autotrophicus TaxID=280 RepID=UPI001E36444B|nr:RES family NAD+ phosphorylase [Xanthobacter autotrophicus]UDQ88972.1 RES family NAD+ phosphorylase [Xanthobacter autotrophicus]